MIRLKWQFVFRNASEKVLVSLKRIIHILTVFITWIYGFWPAWSELSYNNLINFRYALSPTSFNERLNVLTYISYYIDNTYYIRLILTVYQTQLASIGRTWSNIVTRFITHARIHAYKLLQIDHKKRFRIHLVLLSLENAHQIKRHLCADYRNNLEKIFINYLRKFNTNRRYTLHGFYLELSINHSQDYRSFYRHKKETIILSSTISII